MEKDARMKVYVKNKENLTVNCRQALQKYTKLLVNGDYRNIVTHKIYHSEMSRADKHKWNVLKTNWENLGYLALNTQFHMQISCNFVLE
jgi:hypothetical protein